MFKVVRRGGRSEFQFIHTSKGRKHNTVPKFAFIHLFVCISYIRVPLCCLAIYIIFHLAYTSTLSTPSPPSSITSIHHITTTLPLPFLSSPLRTEDLIKICMPSRLRRPLNIVPRILLDLIDLGGAQLHFMRLEPLGLLDDLPGDEDYWEDSDHEV